MAEQTSTHPGAVQLGNAGILTRTPPGGVKLADDVRFSLVLDET